MILRRPQPTDFASIDVDGDTIQQGQPLEVIAFVDGDYPVLFETNLGTLRSSLGAAVGQSLLCYANVGSAASVGDPDCDANPATIGDGVVAIRLIVAPGDPRGNGIVTVTQNGISKQLQFTVTGAPKTISFESLDGRTEIETDADSCEPVMGGVPSGSSSPNRTHVFVRALDDQGTPVVGALIAWDRQFSLSGTPLGSPHGGTALPQLPTWMFDGKGAGAVLVACGGNTPGLLSIGAKFDLILASYSDPDYRTTFEIPVVQASAFCVDTGAPGQSNQDSERIRLGNGKYDVTNPAADVVIDACDTDMDGDGLPNEQESLRGTGALVWDTDGDLASDGAEVRCGSNPLLPASNISGVDTDNDGLPDDCEGQYRADPASPDTDSDGLLDGVEVRYWLTNPLEVNTDGDNCADGREVASVNNDRTVNIADYGILASSLGPVAPGFRTYDQNGDGVINVVDRAFVASKFGRCSTSP